MGADLSITLPAELINAIADRVATIVKSEIDATTSASGRAQMLTMSEAADFLSVHKRTVSRLVERGELHAYDIAGCTRLRLTDLEEYIQSSKREPPTGSTRPSPKREHSAVERSSGLSFAERLRCLERQ